MSDHNRAVFNNSCLRVPIHPCSARPSPVYEQQLNSSALIHSQSRTMDSTEQSPIKSLIAFYGSIPEYDDVHHLNNREFYRKVTCLKEKQKQLWTSLQKETKTRYKRSGWVEDYAKLGAPEKSSKRPTSCIVTDCRSTISDECEKKMSAVKRRKFRSTPSLNKDCNPDSPYSFKDRARFCTTPVNSNRKMTVARDAEWIDDFKNLSISSKPEASIGSEKDHSPLSNHNLPGDDINDREQLTANPDSPSKSKPMVGWKENGITIPKPFKMTVRDEENKIIDEIVLDIKKPEKNKEKPDMFRAHPIPIESRIPLYDKLMNDQEIRSLIAKERRKQTLKSQMRPFSFTPREEEMNAIAKRLSLSTPSLTFDEKPIKTKKFKAKPIPKRIFSNYAYRKMHEDEFYRALQRKIRAEEMLKASSLPPSMAKREKSKPKPEICPKSFLYLEDGCPTTSTNFKTYREDISRELDHFKDDFINSSYQLKSAKLNEKRLRKCYGNRRSISSISKFPSSDLLSVNRSNLAAILRIQSAKKKQEMEIMQRIEEVKLKEETRWREKVLRKKPAWQTIAYSNEEDLAMRLELRREEERLRNEQHRHRMELMYGRVNKRPLLFERQSQNNQYPVTRQQLIDQLCHAYKQCNATLTISDTTDEDKETVANHLDD